MYVKLGYFQPGAIKANVEGSSEYERLNNEALIVPQTISTISPRTLLFILPKTRSLLT